MEITKDKVAVIDYVLKDDNGEILDQSENGEFAFLAGANGIIPGLENSLEGKKAGDELTVKVEPKDGYGEFHPDAEQEIPKSNFPEDMEILPEMQFHAESPAGEIMVLTVLEVKDETILATSNHPLAGQVLHFDVKVIEVRDANAAEIEHGHVHGPGGHHA